MTIAVLSDLHDNVTNWEIIVKLLTQEGVTVLLNCGDTCSPMMLATMAKAFPGAIHTVFGNVADRELELERVRKLPNVTHYGDQAEFTLAGKKIALTHFPEVAKSLAASGSYDLVCYGHNHLKRIEMVGRTLLVNPGTAGGMFQYPSFAFIDIASMQARLVDIHL